MKTALRNVRVFDGRQLLPPGTVVLDGERIGADASGAKMVVDGAGAVLLPRLTDAHLHLDGRSALERLVRFGVTTAVDMANAPPEFVDSMRGIRGLTDIRSAGTAALAPGSIHSQIPEIGERGLIRTAGDAERFVTERFAEGSDFLKILIDLPGPSPDRATVDALTHTPLDRPLDRTAADRMAAAGRMLNPTLAMMEALTAPSTPPEMLAVWRCPTQAPTARGRASLPRTAPAYRSWPEPTPTAMPRRQGTSRSATACTTSWNCSSMATRCTTSAPCGRSAASGAAASSTPRPAWPSSRSAALAVQALRTHIGTLGAGNAGQSRCQPWHRRARTMPAGRGTC